MNRKGFAPILVLLIVLGLVVVGGGALYLGSKSAPAQPTPTVSQTPPESQEVNGQVQPSVPNTKKITRNSYSFEAPLDWIDNGQKDFEGCSWDGISKGGDGLRMGGGIGIYQKSCFDLSKALGKKEFTEKEGYYIIAFYDRESGTTAQEEQETKLAYQKVVDTFSLVNLSKQG